MSPPNAVAAVLTPLVSLALPSTCVGCRRARGPICPTCRTTIDTVGSGGAARVWPDPVPAGLPPTWATTRLAGTVRLALTAYKDHGRRDLTGDLAALLALSITRARGAPDQDLVLVPIPGSARAVRRRGDRPLEALTLAAAQLLPGSVRVVRALEPVRAVADQSGLDHVQRRTNLEGALAVVPSAVSLLAGQRLVLVDDIMTTGSTLCEGARALGAEGHRPRAACVAVTTRRRS